METKIELKAVIDEKGCINESMLNYFDLNDRNYLL
jgi:hypothetical protein